MPFSEQGYVYEKALESRKRELTMSFTEAARSVRHFFIGRRTRRESRGEGLLPGRRSLILHLEAACVLCPSSGDARMGHC
jgi:hypothetical protein